MTPRRDRQISVAQLVAILAGALVVIGGVMALVIWLRPPGAEWSDSVRSIGFGAAAVIAVPVGYIAYRRQRTQEQQHTLAAGQEDRAARQEFRERFVSATTQIGADSIMARIAGVYALANLADEWGLVEESQRQVCIDVLCAYLRTTYDPTADNLTTETIAETTSSGTRSDHTTISDTHTTRRGALRDDRDVRLTIIRLIRDHLHYRPGIPNDLPGDPPHEPPLWRGCSFDFTQAVFPAGTDFSDAELSGGNVSFRGAEFSGGQMSFSGTQFSGSTVSFVDAKFPRGEVSFRGAQFSEGTVSFVDAEFSGASVLFGGAEFSGGEVLFERAKFSGASVSFVAPGFFGRDLSFRFAEFTGGRVSFLGAKFSAGEVLFDFQHFSGGQVDFKMAKFSGSDVSFGTLIKRPGREVSFDGAEFTGGEVTIDGLLGKQPFRGWSTSE